MFAISFIAFILSFTSDSLAKLTPDKDTLNFPSLKISLSKDGPITVTNTGAVTETVTKIFVTPLISTGSEFQYISSNVFPFDIPAGVSRQFFIRFTPLVSGLRTALLTFATTTDSLFVPMQGFGLVSEPDAEMLPPAIDFGVRLPGEVIDTFVRAVALGPDSATIINFIVANDNAVICYEANLSDATQQFPVNMQPGDSLLFHVRFTPALPEGKYTGQLDLLGNDTGSPTCYFTGVVAEPAMVTEPGLIDLGIVTIGSVIDTSIFIINTSKITDHITQLSALAAPFTYINPPPLPYDLAAGDTLRLKVEFSAAQFGQFSATVDVTEHTPPIAQSDRLTSIAAQVQPHVLTSQIASSINIACGLDSEYMTSITLKDTGAYSIDISSIDPSNSGLSISKSPLPLTMQPASQRTI
ncbi:MAG TPA: choice-of-anchor D domain-containing protein, partial [Steroidobacteraceae bacterium]|nr:choice-of-anchor D domain-containing protein [Steroidobacteraceae bacterium]